MFKILVIEDEEMLRRDVTEWLTFEGYEVFTAVDGVDGVNAAAIHLPDLIICDIMMPRLDGYGVLLDIRTNSLTQMTPFIFTTARAGHDDIRNGMNQGADDYLTKPFARLELLQAVQNQIKKKAAYEREKQRQIEVWRVAFEQEHEQRLLKAKMVGMFSHDFRNPLTTIMSSIGIVRDYADRLDEQRRLIHLNRAEASVRQLVQMLDEMLFLSQIDSNSLSIQMETVSVEDLLQLLVNEFQTLHNTTHKLLFESKFPNPILSDTRLLRQIVTNLISNAIKYSPDGGEVSISLDTYEGGYRLTVQDHGIGIPEVDQSRMFDAFQRGSNVKEMQGTGLGLVIVKQAVDLLGGSVRLESQVGVGTTIIVQIPLIDEKK